MLFTTGEIVDAVKPELPIVNEDMVRAWLEEDLLPHYRNPIKKNGWYKIKSEGIEPFLREKLHFTAQQTYGVLKRLGLNFNQILLKLTA